MKRVALLTALLLVSLQLLSQQTTSPKVKGNYQDLPLDLVLLDLKVRYNLLIEYERKQVKDTRISASFNSIPLENALRIFLNDTNLDYAIKDGRRIVIFEKAAPLPEISGPTRKNFTIKGVVRDKNSGEALPFANLLVEGTTIGANTNVDGYFTLFEVPSDTAVLVVSYIGYQTLRFSLHPAMDMSNLLVRMEDFGVQMEEVIVEAQKKEQLIQASAGISQVSIAPAALNKIPSYGEKDIFRSLQLLPGISGSNESSSGLYVRGGTPDQNLILFDGFTVYHVDHLFGFFSAFNTNAVKDVQLYKGGFEAKYGGRISSVVELTGKDGNTENFNVGAGLSLLSGNAFAEGPFAKSKGSFLVAGRRSFQSNFYTNIFDAFTQSSQAESNQPQPPMGGGFGRGLGQQQVTPNTYFYDLNAKVTFRPSSRDLVALSFFNGQDDLDNSRISNNNSFGPRFGGNLNFNFRQENTDLTNWGNWGSSAKWSRRWNDRFYSNANLSFSNYFSERDRRNSTNIVRSDSSFTRSTGFKESNDLKDYTFKVDNELKINPNNQLEFGMQASWQDIRYDFTQNDSVSVLDRHDSGLTASLYVQDRLTLSEKLILKGGLRSTYYTVTGKPYLEPRASLTYLISQRWKLKAAAGQYFQFATRVVREDIQQGSRDFWLLANDETAPVSSAVHLIAGGSYETPVFLFDLEAWYKDLKGLSEYSTRFVPSGFGPGQTLSYQEFFYTGTGVAKGVEFLAQKKVGALTGWLGYTLGQVQYDFAAFGDQPFYANQDQTHEFKVVANYKLGKFTFGGTFIYATGRPYTAPTGFYQLTLLDGRVADFFEVSDKNALRLPDYHRLDLSATFDFRIAKNKASAGLSLFNIYNRSNVWYKEYEVVEGSLLETNVSLLGFTPSLFLSWSLR